MSAIVTYDVTEKHVQVKKAMKAKGYQDYWDHDDKKVYLPNTTLWKATADVKAGLADIQAVTSDLKVTLKRVVVVERGAWTAIWGTPHEE